MFTLPANITYLTGSMSKNNIFFFDPLPPYDPAGTQTNPATKIARRSRDCTQLYNAAQSRTRITNGVYLTASQQAQIDKAKALEVSSVQVDQVYGQSWTMQPSSNRAIQVSLAIHMRSTWWLTAQGPSSRPNSFRTNAKP